MKKILISALCVILAMLFVVTLYVHGEGKRFSLKKWMISATVFVSTLSMVGNVSRYWENSSFMDGDVEIKPEEMIDVPVVDWLVGPILGFFGTIKGFFIRCFYTIRHCMETVGMTFYVSRNLLPWNCTVEVMS